VIAKNFDWSLMVVEFIAILGKCERVRVVCDDSFRHSNFIFLSPKSSLRFPLDVNDHFVERHLGSTLIETWRFIYSVKIRIHFLGIPSGKKRSNHGGIQQQSDDDNDGEQE